MSFIVPTQKKKKKKNEEVLRELNIFVNVININSRKY